MIVFVPSPDDLEQSLRNSRAGPSTSEAAAAETRQHRSIRRRIGRRSQRELDAVVIERLQRCRELFGSKAEEQHSRIVAIETHLIELGRPDRVIQARHENGRQSPVVLLAKPPNLSRVRPHRIERRRTAWMPFKSELRAMNDRAAANGRSHRGNARSDARDPEKRCLRQDNQYSARSGSLRRAMRARATPAADAEMAPRRTPMLKSAWVLTDPDRPPRRFGSVARRRPGQHVGASIPDYQPVPPCRDLPHRQSAPRPSQCPAVDRGALWMLPRPPATIPSAMTTLSLQPGARLEAAARQSASHLLNVHIAR